MNASDLTIGQEVRVFNVNGKRYGYPEDGHRGTVTKIGRSLATIDVGRLSAVYRIDTQQKNDQYGHEWFRTLEQVAEDELRQGCLATLKAHGLVPDSYGGGMSIPTALLEALAETAAASVRTVSS